METSAPIGTLIRIARTERGVTRQELAQAVDISVSSLASIERGLRTPRPHVVRKITAELVHREFTGPMLDYAIARRYLGIQELAHLLGITHSHLANLRAGIREFTPDMLDRLIAVMVLRPDDLLFPGGIEDLELAAQDAA